MLIKYVFWLFPSISKQVIELVNAAVQLERQQCVELARSARTQWTPYGNAPTYHGIAIADEINNRTHFYQLPEENKYKIKTLFTNMKNNLYWRVVGALQAVTLSIVMINETIFEGW